MSIVKPQDGVMEAFRDTKSYSYVKDDGSRLSAELDESSENAALLDGMDPYEVARREDYLEPVEAIQLRVQGPDYSRIVNTGASTPRRRQGELPASFTALLSVDGQEVLSVLERRVDRGATLGLEQIHDFPAERVLALLEEVTRLGLTLDEISTGNALQDAAKHIADAERLESQARALRSKAEQVKGGVQTVLEGLTQRLAEVGISDVAGYVQKQRK
ncbi:MAG: hypothetical protein AAB373_03610 [Patescibacteria group bacterium]